MTGSRLIARFTGGGSGCCGSGGGGTGATRPRTAVTAADRRVITAPHAEHSRPPRFTVSHTLQRQSVFIGIAARRACRATCPGVPVRVRPGGLARARRVSEEVAARRAAPGEQEAAKESGVPRLPWFRWRSGPPCRVAPTERRRTSVARRQWV